MVRATMHLFAVPLMLAMGGVARADSAVTHTDLLCGRNVALVRFAVAENDDPPQYTILSPKLEGGLSTRPGTGRTDCQLERGLDLRIRAGEEQVFPYGMGGADPPAFFSLWINHKKILSKFVWKPGYVDAFFDEKSRLVGLVIRSRHLTFCYRKPSGKTVTCKQQRLELPKHPVDTEEYPLATERRPPVGTILIEPTSADAAACQRYLEAIRKDTNFPFDILPPNSQLSESNLPPRTAGGSYWLGTLDGAFANVGERRIFTLGSGTHYFDGDFVVIAPHTTSPDDIVAAIPDGDIEGELAKPKPDGWTVLSGGLPGLYPNVSPRYVHFLPETIDGELFYLAYPTNHDMRPTGILVKPLATAGFASLCNYQRVEPHY